VNQLDNENALPMIPEPVKVAPSFCVTMSKSMSSRRSLWLFTTNAVVLYNRQENSDSEEK
jgi:hypothetical protein